MVGADLVVEADGGKIGDTGVLGIEEPDVGVVAFGVAINIESDFCAIHIDTEGNISGTYTKKRQ